MFALTFYYPMHDSESSCSTSKITETFNCKMVCCDKFLLFHPINYKVPVFKKSLHFSKSVYLLSPNPER